MQYMEGAYAMVLASPDSAVCVPRPATAFVRCASASFPTIAAGSVSSETCGLDIVGAEFVRDVAPGRDHSHQRYGSSRRCRPSSPAEPRGCIFEYVYFARPDSVMDGPSVYQARRNMGRILAREAPVEADLVLGVPDCGHARCAMATLRRAASNSPTAS